MAGFGQQVAATAGGVLLADAIRGILARRTAVGLVAGPVAVAAYEVDPLDWVLTAVEAAAAPYIAGPPESVYLLAVGLACFALGMVFRYGIVRTALGFGAAYWMLTAL